MQISSRMGCVRFNDVNHAVAFTVISTHLNTCRKRWRGVFDVVSTTIIKTLKLDISFRDSKGSITSSTGALLSVSRGSLRKWICHPFVFCIPLAWMSYIQIEMSELIILLTYNVNTCSLALFDQSMCIYIYKYPVGTWDTVLFKAISLTHPSSKMAWNSFMLICLRHQFLRSTCAPPNKSSMSQHFLWLS